ncbi:hypothetical protein B0190_02120 [[Haemophilus] ducreyi]|nr:hypothetical protein B0190_02120 [[Haemophilus] ducreyi]SEV85908.1 biotin synthesis protein BioG [[Haemophilus] ducreyi]VEG83430.1 dithiobiotin synthetase [[Haemophilus] ducreyi]
MKSRLFSTNQPNLIIYFAGWATPLAVVNHLALPPNYDLLFCYDYRDLTFERPDLSHYQQIRLVAWSMGGWVAQKVCQIIPLVSATAVNGTLLPKHNDFGIPTAIFDGTLTSLNEVNRLKFARRMCGGKTQFERYQQLPDHRPFVDVLWELNSLNQAISDGETLPAKLLPWSHIFIGQKDKIFPAENQQRFWQQYPVKICPLEQGEHYLWYAFSDGNSYGKISKTADC